MVFIVQEPFYDTISNPIMDIDTTLNTTINTSITTKLLGFRMPNLVSNSEPYSFL